VGISGNERNEPEPRWVATGPLLPAGMFVATLIAAFYYPDAWLSWAAPAMCAVGVIVLVARAWRIKRREAAHSNQRPPR